MNAKIIESKPVNEPGSNYLCIDLQDMSKRITNKTKVIFIANPSNPTGTILKVKEIDDFIKSISKKIIVVIDEAYYEYSLFRGFKSAINLVKKYP
jgi:histidinol-phosphate aminotransferase